MFEGFQDGILDISGPGLFLAIQSHQVAPMPTIKFRFNLMYGSRKALKNFKMAGTLAFLDIGTDSESPYCI